eukprot:CAMPEP_0115238880 /NCGR_PEP_ID=MMETSP0270-20121206/37111_1 /TAXON_ID=71861 /ORGANISM="Scrippsiella trochoidea, Strain CCMP3099" /LENGTH=238 /DNA_ID=CAMNT_0002653821 /DNA_START=1 /DNA_END=713 /DNA_ORIENTATION=-
MPKVQRARTKYHDLAPPLQPAPFEPPEEVDAGDAAEVDPATGMSRGKRKRMKQREDFMRKFEFVNFTEKQDEVRRSGSLDLGDLAGGLDEIAAGSAASGRARSAPAEARRPGRKAEAVSSERELAQYQGVLGFEAFKQDPLGALEQHLKNSLKRQKQEEDKKEAQQREQDEQEKARAEALASMVAATSGAAAWQEEDKKEAQQREQDEQEKARAEALASMVAATSGAAAGRRKTKRRR